MSKDIGIDLGTTKIVIAVRGRGIVLNEPSCVAKDTTTSTIIKFGKEARNMTGRTPDNVEVVRPMRDGVISRYDDTLKMLQYDLRKVCGNAVVKPRAVVCVPVGVTEVERRAVFDAVITAGVKQAFIKEEPLIAALGAGINVADVSGNMIIDIGGGTTDVAVISGGEIVRSGCLRTGGDKMDEALIRYVRRKYNLIIGERTAEDAKIAVGSIITSEDVNVEVKGKCAVEGLPKAVILKTADLKEALEEPCLAITGSVKEVLEQTPPELLDDIRKNGIVMTGGGSLLHGLDKLLEMATGFPVRVAEDAPLCVINGTERFWDGQLRKKRRA